MNVSPTVASASVEVLRFVTPLQFFTGDFLYYGLLFAGLAVVAAILGARGVAGISMEIARLLILVFLVLAIVSLVL